MHSIMADALDIIHEAYIEWAIAKAKETIREREQVRVKVCLCHILDGWGRWEDMEMAQISIKI